MHVTRGISAVVFYFQVISSSFGLKAFCNDSTRTDGIYGSTHRSGIVHAVMGAVYFQFGMKTAVGKAGGYTEIIQGSFQESPFQTVSFLIVEQYFTVL